MASQKFRVKNPAGMWLRSSPVINDETRKVLLPNGHLVTKLEDTENPDWWRVSTRFNGKRLQGVSNKHLLAPVAARDTTSSLSPLIDKTLAVLKALAPRAHSNYLQAIRDGEKLFQKHEIITALRMAHFLAQALQETGCFTVLRENMSYSVPRMLEIFGVAHHSARITAEEAPSLAHNAAALAERVYGLGNPHKARELGKHPRGRWLSLPR
jgi:hypothetical protein